MTRTYSFLSGASTRGLAGNGAGRKAGMVVLGAVGLALAGCADQSGTGGAAVPSEPKAANSHKIGVLLPLSGPNAALGRELLSGAQLAISEATTGAATAQGQAAGLQMDVHDTAAAGGAAAAATAAAQAGDGIILGPLTAVDTAAAAPAAQAASMPVLAFTSDVNQARPGVWVMGITPEDQVERLVDMARKEGRHRFAAFLPDNPLGHALGNGLLASCRDQGLTPPTIVYHTASTASITQMMRELSAYDTRVADAKSDAGAAPSGTAADPAAPPAADTAANGADKDLPSDLAAALNSGRDAAGASSSGAAAQASGQGAGKTTLAPPPFDALLLGDTGLGLKNVIAALGDSQVSSASVRVMGPGLWAAFASKLGALKGAWYAAPDPSSRQSFVTRFMARNHHMPRPLADLSYDAATVATTVARVAPHGYPVDVLTRQQGFAGVNGPFTLLPDGRARRALGVFEVLGNGGGAKLIVPASTKSAVSG
ncbi:penicillin-binding protein activator [Acetobacter farinalis]|uniref:penicillin-binding protein activator n=1 Tax=Acetobacter farinalis TaxID=1260984 RepID=UPI00140CCF24|nr:ABC transporter substrate-binding protein [Acetobacter farinalis]